MFENDLGWLVLYNNSNQRPSQVPACLCVAEKQGIKFMLYLYLLVDTVFELVILGLKYQLIPDGSQLCYLSDSKQSLEVGLNGV